MSRNSESAVRIKRLRGALSQGEFAKEVGMPQPRVSEYESGKLPSVQMRVLLGTFAAKEGKYADAVWFWKWAGIPTDALLLMASRLATKRAVSSEIVPIPLMPNIAEQEKAETAGVLQLDKSVVPHEEETSYLRIPDRSFVPRMLHVGDLIVIDAFETDPWKLEGSLVAAYRSPELKDEKLQREFEKSNAKEEVNERRSLGIHPYPRLGLFVGWLQTQRVGDGVNLILAGTERERAEMQEPVALWPDYYLRRDPADRTPAFSLKIFGRVLSWFPSQTDEPLVKKSPKG